MTKILIDNNHIAAITQRDQVHVQYTLYISTSCGQDITFTDKVLQTTVCTSSSYIKKWQWYAAVCINGTLQTPMNTSRQLVKRSYRSLVQGSVASSNPYLIPNPTIGQVNVFTSNYMNIYPSYSRLTR